MFSFARSIARCDSTTRRFASSIAGLLRERGRDDTPRAELGGTDSQVVWDIVGPAPIDIVLPLLPADLVDLQSNGWQAIGPEVISDFDNIAGYDVARQHVFDPTDELNRRNATRTRMSRGAAP